MYVKKGAGIITIIIIITHLMFNGIEISSKILVVTKRCQILHSSASSSTCIMKINGGNADNSEIGSEFQFGNHSKASDMFCCMINVYLSYVGDT